MYFTNIGYDSISIKNGVTLIISYACYFLNFTGNWCSYILQTVNKYIAKLKHFISISVEIS